MCESSNKRAELRALLKSFAAQEITIQELQPKLEALLRSNLRAAFSEKEWRRFYREFAYVIDMYDPALPPRSGCLGSLRDLFGQMILGNYRVSPKMVEESVARLLEWM